MFCDYNAIHEREVARTPKSCNMPPKTKAASRARVEHDAPDEVTVRA